jgi:hypothetical protein
VSNLRNNNFLALLAVAQTALILVLLFKVINLENQSNEPVTDDQEAASSEQPAASQALGRPIENPRQLDENRLRQIVREELRAQLGESLASAAQAAEEEVPDPVSEAEYQYRLDAAMQNLDYHIEQGEISNTDMIKLQSEIALLDEDGRRQMLGRLARAMSTGELEGHF